MVRQMFGALVNVFRPAARARAARAKARVATKSGVVSPASNPRPQVAGPSRKPSRKTSSGRDDQTRALRRVRRARGQNLRTGA